MYQFLSFPIVSYHFPCTSFASGKGQFDQLQSWIKGLSPSLFLVVFLSPVWPVSGQFLTLCKDGMQHFLVVFKRHWGLSVPRLDVMNNNSIGASKGIEIQSNVYACIEIIGRLKYLEPTGWISSMPIGTGCFHLHLHDRNSILQCNKE